ncbi:hypothetical protein [Galbibacter sp. PAP.153]|uniref:hypothetical protein n=1 Tax=Galbibacter sp. PAP.153 TaxID=3104623 RepID=UPI0030097825
MNLKEIITKLNNANDTIISKINELNNRQLSLIITCCTMGIFLLFLLNIHLAGQQKEEFLYELSFEEELPKDVIPMEEEMKLTELETHKAYNEAEKSQYADEVDNFKTLEELEQEAQEAASENPNNSLEANNDLSLNDGYASEYAKKLKEQREKIEALKRKGDAPKINIKRRTTITYSLIDRMHVKLPNPVYTCESFGKVVINIKVDGYGNVTDASYNKGSSTTSNGCLIDNAITYALKARFTAKNGTPEQLGTITYLFQGE